MARLGRRLRSSAGVVWHYPERILHRIRGASARRRVARAVPIGSALFICHGNVCRSPFAAIVFARTMRDATGTDLLVSSAGFIGPGRQPPSAALDAARRRHVDMTEHRSALVTPQSLAVADLVVVMGAEQAVALRNTIARPRGTVLVLGDLDPHPIVRRTIRDPWGGSDAVFDESYDRVERCVAELVRSLTESVAAR